MWPPLRLRHGRVSSLVHHAERKTLGAAAETFGSHPENLDRLALAESVDQGKAGLAGESVDIPVRFQFPFYATGILHDSTEAHAMEETAINYTLRTPSVSPVVSRPGTCRSTSSPGRSPRRLHRDAVVAKPSEITPMTAYLLSDWPSKPDYLPACSTSYTDWGPRSAPPSCRTLIFPPSRLPAARRPERPFPALPLPCSRNFLSSWAARTRRSYSPMPTLKNRFTRPCVRPFRTRARSVSVVRASSLNAASTKVPRRVRGRREETAGRRSDAG